MAVAPICFIFEQGARFTPTMMQQVIASMSVVTLPSMTVAGIA
ncbi:MAG: hypothetical protein PHE17_07220 [Thiothrix sp.]|jgi:hypothetical protein|nr:hypothetical protein [Thiothrix sp.]MDD5392794.1 hypothetical protein [Thiothrix sp.]